MKVSEARRRLREAIEAHGLRETARRLRVSRTYLDDTNKGRELFSEEMRERIRRYSEGLPAVEPRPRISAAEAPATEDEKTWFQRTHARVIEAQLLAQAAKDSIVEAEWLCLSPLYQQLRGLLLDLGLVPGLEAVLLPPPEDGPAADIQVARRRLTALRRISKRREKALPVDDHKRRLAHTRLRATIAAHLRRIDRGMPPKLLVKGEPWRQAMAAICALLQPDLEIRQIVLEVLDQEPPAQLFARTLWRELQAVRSLTFPCPQYENDPVGYILRVIGRNPWEGQVRIATAVVGNKFVVAVTGHKIGKTAFISWLGWWWVSIHPDGRVMVTNFTGQQLQNQDWFEFRKAHRESGICWDCRQAGVTERPCPHSQILEGECSDDVLAGWKSDDGNRFIVGVTAKEPTAAGGYSGNHLMVIADEFSGMPYALFDGYVTGASAKGAKFIGLGNPIGDDGPMYDIVNRPALRKNFHVEQISSEEAAETGIEGLADKGYIAVMAAADPRGKESPTYLRRCGGRYPSVEEKRAFSLKLIERFFDVDAYETAPMIGPLIVSIDPAGPKGTGDEIAVGATRGHRVLSLTTALGWEPEQYLAAVLEAVDAFAESRRELVHVVIDSDGEGAKIAPVLCAYAEDRGIPNRANLNVIRMYNGQDAHYLHNEYNHVVDEATLALAEWIAEGGCAQFDAKLDAEMRFAKWNVRKRMRKERIVDLTYVTPKDGKDGFRAGLGRSPDRLDALRLMAWARMVLGLDVRNSVVYTPPALVPADFSPVQGLPESSTASIVPQGVDRGSRVRAEYSARMARIAAQKYGGPRG